MKIIIPLKPLSINAAFQGKRFKTKDHNRYCKDVALFLPRNQRISGYVQITYRFFLKNWKMTDGGNLEKCLTDILVKAGLIDDDRFILRYILEKYPANDDHIEVEITEYAQDWLKETA